MLTGEVADSVRDQIVKIEDGTVAIVWKPPSGLTFFTAEPGKPFVANTTIEIAPTAIDDLARVDFSAPNLQWFKFRTESRSKVFPKETLLH